jgi:hypothetical protein
MTIQSAKLSAIFLVIFLCLTAPAHAQWLNPFSPMNATAAEPIEPYNLDQIPCKAYVYYLPCPTCGPMSKLLPDIPPVWERFPGPYGICVPVP